MTYEQAKDLIGVLHSLLILGYVVCFALGWIASSITMAYRKRQ